MKGRKKRKRARGTQQFQGPYTAADSNYKFKFESTTKQNKKNTDAKT